MQKLQDAEEDMARRFDWKVHMKQPTMEEKVGGDDLTAKSHARGMRIRNADIEPAADDDEAWTVRSQRLIKDGATKETEVRSDERYLVQRIRTTCTVPDHCSTHCNELECVDLCACMYHIVRLHLYHTWDPFLSAARRPWAGSEMLGFDGSIQRLYFGCTV